MAGRPSARTHAVDRRTPAARGRAGQLAQGTDIKALADFYATQLHGISVQSRDGVSKERLLASIGPAMMPLAMAVRTGREAARLTDYRIRIAARNRPAHT